MEKFKPERTIVLVKPDGVFRGLVGEVITRFEKRGLKIVGMKMVWATKEHIDKHYPTSTDWLTNVGKRTSEFIGEKGKNIKEYFGTEDHEEIGKQIKGWLNDYLTQGPVVAMVIEGPHAISTVRKLIGSTYPVEALPGTIRGDFSVDTPAAANMEKRVIKNIVHASGNEEEAAHEIEHWFSPEEIHSYKRVEEDVMFSQ